MTSAAGGPRSLSLSRTLPTTWMSVGIVALSIHIDPLAESLRGLSAALVGAVPEGAVFGPVLDLALSPWGLVWLGLAAAIGSLHAGGTVLGQRWRQTVTLTPSSGAITVCGRIVPIDPGRISVRPGWWGTIVAIGRQRILRTSTAEAWIVAEALSDAFGNERMPTPTPRWISGSIAEAPTLDGVVLTQHIDSPWSTSEGSFDDAMAHRWNVLMRATAVTLMLSVGALFGPGWWPRAIAGIVLLALARRPPTLDPWGRILLQIDARRVRIETTPLFGRRRTYEIPIPQLDPPRIVIDDARRPALALSNSGRLQVLLCGGRPELQRIVDWLDQARQAANRRPALADAGLPDEVPRPLRHLVAIGSRRSGERVP